MDKHFNFQHMDSNEREGVDYQIRWQKGVTGFCIMAIHGGGIEPGTSEIAEGIAAEEHSYYAFLGMKAQGNRSLHLTSALFDEPKALRLARMSETTIAIHGCEGHEPLVYVGGLDIPLIEKVTESLGAEEFTVLEHPTVDLQGIHPENICNKGLSGKGVQLEITKGLRSQMFKDLTANGRNQPTESFYRFVRAIRNVLRGP
jgi:phage replication-related protein YjqB (UPF0714/DUF867 family)